MIKNKKCKIANISLYLQATITLVCLYQGNLYDSFAFTQLKVD